MVLALALASAAILVDMLIITMQFLQYAFPEDSGWHDSVKAPMIAIGSLVSFQLPRNLYFYGLYTCLTLMLSAIIIFFGDAHGALVRHMEARRLAGTGITLEVDFKNKTGVTMKGPVWLETCRMIECTAFERAYLCTPGPSKMKRNTAANPNCNPRAQPAAWLPSQHRPET